MYKLSDAQQAAIVATVALGKSQNEVAIEFGVHRNTVNQLCKKVRAQIKNAPALTRTERLERATDDAIDTMGGAVQKDWRAADTHLRGRGIYGSVSKHEFAGNIVVSWANEDSDVMNITAQEVKQLVDNKE